MDKEKQIEDKKQLISILRNSKDIVSYQPNAREIPFWGSDKRKFFIQDDNGHLTIHFDKIVDEIYKQGYRKIPEGSVVLSKEEYLRMVVEEEAIARVREKQARKQAVKEVLEKLHNSLDKSIPAINGVSVMLIKNMIDETAKEFGVEL